MQIFQRVGSVSSLQKEFLQFKHTRRNSLFRFPQLPRLYLFLLLFALIHASADFNETAYKMIRMVTQGGLGYLSPALVSHPPGLADEYSYSTLIVMAEEQMWKSTQLICQVSAWITPPKLATFLNKMGCQVE